MMVLLAIVVAFVSFDPLGIISPLEEAEVVSCDERAVRLDGREAELLNLHNEARIERGLGELCVREELMAAARGHSEDMIRRGFYAHETPEGANPGNRLSRAGYSFSTYAENISRMSGSYGGEPSRGELKEVFEGWMESKEGHRENLLNPNFHEVGIGVKTGRYTSEPGTTSMYTVDFGARK